MTTQLPLLAATAPPPPPAPPPRPCPAPPAPPQPRPDLPVGSVVALESWPGLWRVRRVGDGWVEVVGEGYRTVAVGEVRR
jgi:hypothetical protein